LLIRKFGYEFFKVTHFASAAVFMLTFFWHCDYTLTSWHYFIATAAIYVPCFVFPWLRTLLEYKWTQQAEIFVEDNDFTRVTIPAKFHWTPGQHCFLRFTGFGVLQAISTHPFTICSSTPKSTNDPSKLVFYIHHQGGFTSKLYQLALNNPGLSVPVLVDGPYGGINPRRLRDTDHLLVIAGGSGAGWCLPFIEHFVQSAATAKDEELGDDALVEKKAFRRQSSRPASIRVILATRDTSSRIWFERTVGELLARYSVANLPSSIQLQVYLTGEAAEKPDLATKTLNLRVSQRSTSSNEKNTDLDKGVETAVPGKEFEGRPDLPLIIHEEASRAAEGSESLSVYICGPPTMQNDVRNAVARENLSILSGNKSGSIYLHSEHFSWA
jgi:predicted ferric reductase